MLPIILLSLFMSVVVFQALASPAALTYQGRILKTDGTPLEYNNVSFIFQITNPTGTCVIYQEQVTGFDMTNSAGVFDVPIGNGSVQYPLGGATSILDVFNNSSSFNCGSCSLVNGTYVCANGSGSYGAADGDTRRLRVSFYDGSGWKTVTPDNVVRSVPFAGYALSAQKLGTNVASDFLLKAGLPTCTAGTFLSSDGTALTCVPVAGASGGTVMNVTSANSYLTVINNTSTPALTLNVGTVANTVAAGDDPRLSDARTPAGAAGGVLNGSYPNPGLVDNSVTTTKINDAAVSTSKLFAISGINRLVATDATTGTTLAPLTCASGQLLIWSATNGWQCSNQSSLAVGSATTATTATTSTNFAGSLAGDVSGTQGATSVDKIKGVPLDFSVAPTNGQVLKFNGTNWAPATDSNASGTITALTSDVSASGSGSVAATVNSVGGSTAANIHSAEVVANAATSANSSRAIVMRDTSGNFSAGTISANLTGNVTGSASLNVLKAGDTMTGHLTFSANKGNVFTDSGTNTVSVQAPTTVSTSYVLRLPTTVASSAGQVLTSDTSGNLSWTTPSTTASSYSGILPIANGGTNSSTAPSAAGQVLRYDGTSTYLPAFLGLADIKAGITPFGGAFASAGCTASQTLYWQSSTDTFVCQSVAIGDSQITYASKTAKTFLAAPNGSDGAPTFRSIASSDLPTTGANGAYVNGGNSFGAAATLGTSDANTFEIKTNNVARMTFDTSGNVGVGTTSPSSVLTTNAGDNTTVTTPYYAWPTNTTRYVTNQYNGSTITSLSGSTSANIDQVSVNLASSSSNTIFGREIYVQVPPSASFNTTGSLVGTSGIVRDYGSVGTGGYLTGGSFGASYHGVGTRNSLTGVSGNASIPNYNSTNQASIASNLYGGNFSSAIGSTGASVAGAFGVNASTSNSGTITTGYQIGVNGTATNSGTINSGQYAGALTAQNNSGATIGSSQYGFNVYALSSGTVTGDQTAGRFDSQNNSGSIGGTQYGVNVSATHSVANTLSTQTGLAVAAYNSGTGTVTTNYGVNSQVGTCCNANASNVGTAYAGFFGVNNYNTGTIGTGYGVYTGTINATNKWSIYASDSTAPSFFAGNVGIGTTSPQTKLEVNGAVSATSLSGPGGVGTPQMDKQYVAGTAYTNGTPDVTGTNFTKIRGVFIPYQTTDGTWRLKFNIVGSFSGAGANNVFGIAISGITTKNIANYAQAISIVDQSLQSNPGYSQGYVNPGANTVNVLLSTVRTYNNTWCYSGDIELDSKPIWAD